MVEANGSELPEKEKGKARKRGPVRGRRANHGPERIATAGI
jgi:hypothetical protein